ncbi:MAG TPA: ABC transporter permease [Longimicrobiales bacterium]|nr:ABC transporter permease [Longimicrobiales bacterium]
MTTAARLWVRLAALLVPGGEREEWVEEWDGELAAHGGSMRHAWGALSDAWYLRREGWTMEGMLRDVRSAVKGLARKPFFTALAGITLAVGIGANTAIYSVVDAVLLNPLPYPDSEAVVSVNHTAPGIDVPILPHSEATYLHYLENFKALSSFAVFSEDNINLLTGDEPQRIEGAVVTREFFDVLGVPPFLGRGFVEGDDVTGAEPVAVLGYGLWRQTFGGDRSVLGTVVEMDGVQRRVVGVMPDGFSFPADAGLWVPRSIDPANAETGSFGLLGIGRLAPGASLDGANAEMQDLLLRFADAHPDEFTREMMAQIDFRSDLKSLKDLYVSDVRQALWVLLGTVGFVLLIACANVANLFLVRAEGRQREQALRTALGASRADIVRFYLTESLTLALGGGLLGLGLAALGVQGLLKLAPVAVPRAAEIGMDASVLLFTLVVSLASGVLFGLFPVLGYARPDLSGALKEGGRATTAGKERHRARSFLVVAQVALALVLLVGSGLMARSFLAMRGVDVGFQADNRLVFRVSLPSAEYADPGSVREFHRALRERMSAIPGVLGAAQASAVPLEDTKNASPMEPEDRPFSENEIAPLVNVRQVTPGYFDAMGITLAEGRDLTDEDAADGVRSVVVSAALAGLYWPGESAVGRRIRNQGADEGWEIVGVVPDVRFERVTDDPTPLIYFPMVAGPSDEPMPTRQAAVVLHVGSDPLVFVAAAREALRETDSRLPMVDPRTMDSVVRDAMAATSFTVLLLGVAASIALLLGTVGIYGVISYVVSRRTQEIGVRMALGAPANVVLREVVGQGMTLAGIGVAVGLVGAWGVSRVLTSLLYGVSPTDPLTYLGTAAVLTFVALAASWIPARRAALVDPVEALRSE